MKKILSLTLISLGLLCSFNQAYSAENNFLKLKKTETKTNTEKSYVSNVYSVSKFFVEYESAANNYNHNLLASLYADNYLNCDGFNKKILTKIIQETWKTYPGMKYKVKLNSVVFNGDTAIADVTEVSKGYAKVEHENVGEFVSTTQTIYYLKRNLNSWLITNEYTAKENVVLSWGDAKLAKIKLQIPSHLSAGQEFSAILDVQYPDKVIAIGSITSEKITYPQKPTKEIYRKLTSETALERIMKANTDNVNEYIVGTVGFTRPKIDGNKNLDIKLTGYSCIMERLNVIPVNKFIEADSGESKQSK